MDDIQKIKKELSELVERVDDVEILANETADHVLELREEHKQHHNELRESHKELKDKQDKVVDENLEQTKILNRIEERYQTQVDVAQKNEEKTLAQNKWLVGAIWALVTIVMIAVVLHRLLRYYLKGGGHNELGKMVIMLFVWS